MDGDRVVKLAVTSAEEEQRQRCIVILEDALKDAKNGRGFDSVMIFATFPDSICIQTMKSSGLTTVDMVGRLEYLKHELLAAMWESEGVPPPRPEGLSG